MKDLSLDPLEYNRQTGRTTRMLEAAVAAAQAGQKVVVIMTNERSVSHWRDQIGSVTGLIFVTMLRAAPQFDWDKLQFTPGPFMTHRVFIDHDVLYLKYLDIFRSYHEYDVKLDQSPYLKETT